MAETGALPKPQLKGLVTRMVKKNLLIGTVLCAAVGIACRVFIGDARKRTYAEFNKNYDINKQFHEIRKKGLFESCK